MSHNNEELKNMVASTVPDEPLDLSQTTQELFAFSRAYVLSAVVDVARTFVTNAYLSQLGEDSNAAGALISTSQLVIISLCCCSYATGIEVGKLLKALRAQQQSNANDQAMSATAYSEIALTSLTLAAILSVALVILSAFIQQELLFLGQDRNLVSITNDFYKGYIWGIPAFVMLSFLRQFVLGQGQLVDARVILGSMAINTVIASLLGYIMTFGVGSFKGYGVIGLGAANSIAFWVNLVILSLFVTYSNRYNQGINLRLPAAWEKLKKNLTDYTIVGGAITVRVGSEFISLFIATLMISDFGDNQLAGEQIANQYMFLMVIPSFGLMQATTITASKYIPLADKKSIDTVVKAGSILGISMSAIMSIVIFSIPKQLISLFINVNDNHATYIVARNLLYINAGIQTPDMLKNLICSLLNAMKDPYTPLIAGVGINVILALSLGYVLGFTAHLKAEGVFIARLITTVVALVMLQRAFVHFDFTQTAQPIPETTATQWCRWLRKKPAELTQKLLEQNANGNGASDAPALDRV